MCYSRQAIAFARRTRTPAIYTLEGYVILGDALLMLGVPADVLEPHLLRDTKYVCDALRRTARIYPLLPARASLADGRYAWLTGD